MRTIDMLINLCSELSKNGYNLRDENHLIDLVYELKQIGIQFPSYNWTLSFGGITSPELRNEIEKLKFFNIIERKRNKMIIVEKNKEKVELILDEINQDDKDQLNSRIHLILNKM